MDGYGLQLLRLIILALLIMPATAFAITPEERGLEIAKEADLRDTGYGDFRAEMRMTLRNRHGKESIREIKSSNLEVPGDGDKILSLFERPRDVKGTAFLSFTHKTGPDDQWLYLPALKRVKRISSANKSGSFMGSEFAFEDISSMEVEKYTYKFIGEKPCGELTCFVVEYDPVDKNSGYSIVETWIDTEEYRAQKVEYYDRKRSHLKTLTYTGYKKYLDKYWRADEMFMQNHLTGKSTKLEWANYKFKTGLTDKDFNKNALKRAR